MLEYKGETWQAEPEQDNDVHSLSRRIALKKTSRPAPKVGYKALVLIFLRSCRNFEAPVVYLFPTICHLHFADIVASVYIHRPEKVTKAGTIMHYAILAVIP